MTDDFERIPQADLNEMQAREKVATKDWLHLHSDQDSVEWVYNHSGLTRTDQPRLRVTLEAAQVEIERLQAELKKSKCELNEYHAAAQTREACRGE